MFKYNIKKRREELGLSLQEVADKVGVNKTTVLGWERGEIGNMRRDRIALLAKALHITPEQFMGWDAPATPKEQKLLDAYLKAKKDNPSIASAIDKLLGIDEQVNE